MSATSTDSKYIVFDNGLNIFPVVFPHFIEHATMKNLFPRIGKRCRRVTW